MEAKLPLEMGSLSVVFNPSRLLDRLYVEHYIPGHDSACADVLAARIEICIVSDEDEIELTGHDRPRLQLFPGQAYAIQVATPSLRRLVATDLTHWIEAEFDANSPVPSRVRVVVTGDASAKFATSIAMRVVRDIYQRLAYAQGAFMMHCSCVTKAGKAVAFLGRKGAGKTPWLLHALSRGWDLLANDRVLINPETQRVFAFPIAVMLDQRTVMSLPTELRQRVNTGCTIRGVNERARLGLEKVGLTPREVAEAYGRSVALSSALDTAYLLHVGSESESRETISESIYCPEDPTYAFDWCTKPVARAGKEEVASRLSHINLAPLQFEWAKLNLVDSFLGSVL